MYSNEGEEYNSVVLGIEIHCSFPDSLDLKTVCNELAKVEAKVFQIGIQLGVPHDKMELFKKGENFLSTVVNYWLSGNVSGVPMSWESVVAALESTHVGESGLAGILRAKYCGQQDGVQDDNS